MESLRQVQDDIQAAETGMRGYLLDRDPTFVTGYRGRAARLPADLKSFRSLTADNSSQQRRAQRLETLIDARLVGLQNGVRAAGRGPLGTPSPIVVQALTRARLQMTGIRAEITAGLAEEQTLLAQRDAGRRQQETLEVAFAVGAGVLTLGILLIAAAMLVRNNVSLGIAERARANEAAILQATLNTVRDGIAYFTSDGLLCAFNAGFFRLLRQSGQDSEYATDAIAGGFRPFHPVAARSRSGPVGSQTCGVGRARTGCVQSAGRNRRFCDRCVGCHGPHARRGHGAPVAEDGSHRPSDRRRRA
jgi:CHASE3 domain sensor protein